MGGALVLVGLPLNGYVSVWIHGVGVLTGVCRRRGQRGFAHVVGMEL
jgi:hypothetical protein